MSENTLSISLRPILSADAISARVEEIAREIDRKYGKEPLVAICVLKGAYMYFADLTRQLRNPNLEVDFVRLASYGMNSSSSKHVIFSKDIEVDILGKHVLIVEDIIDSGHTMRFLLDQMAARNPLSIAITALIDKHERREAEIAIEFPGFQLPEGYMVGYGMDYAEHMRSLPSINEVEFGIKS